MKNKKKPTSAKRTHFFKRLGSGIITGASDDDPSGIATYSQAGAQFGLATLWTAFISFPLMLCIQEMCARIGMSTGQGLTGLIQKHYSPLVLWIIIILTVPAIILNISADIAGMAAVAHLVLPAIPEFVYSIFFTALLTCSLIFMSYTQIVRCLKYFCLSLLLYIAIPFITEGSWMTVFSATFAPKITWSKEYFLVLVAILGTTISPYLFFWQTTMEAERRKKMKHKLSKQEFTNMRQDVTLGMFFSNLVMYFLILTTGIILFNNGIHQVETVEQAAKALEPLAGPYAYALFALGIIATGFLAVPVLTGSISYILATALHWKAGLNKKFHQAKGFYTLLISSMLSALLINFFKFSAMKLLFYTAILYGLTAPILIFIILLIANNKEIMGEHRNGYLSNILGVITLTFMLGASILLVFL
jgi:NRAMP (natural resistance-associated macrophage protein)-like metal ion transporter